MRTIPLVLITFFALSLSPTAARAGANGSWCANYGTGLDGAINCSYTSFEQCRATVSGIYGFCTPNPYPGTGYGRGGGWDVTPARRGLPRPAGLPHTPRARRGSRGRGAPVVAARGGGGRGGKGGRLWGQQSHSNAVVRGH